MNIMDMLIRIQQDAELAALRARVEAAERVKLVCRLPLTG